jgi:hypothetical protein
MAQQRPLLNQEQIRRLPSGKWWALVDDLGTAELEPKRLRALFMNGGSGG